MSDIIDISNIAGKFKNRAELQLFTDKLILDLKSSVERLKQLQAENQHLKQLLLDGFSNVKKIEVPLEQATIEIELQRLHNTSIERALNFEETKRLDILVKNLHQIKERAAESIPTVKRPTVVYSEAELLQIASDKNE